MTLKLESVQDDFRRLGLSAGDTVMLHSRATALDRAHELIHLEDTGMKLLLDALRGVLGERGVLAVPTFTRTFRDEASGPTGDVWNPQASRSRVGSFTNYVLAQPGRARSDHPTHSVAALGAGAEDFCAGHSWREGASTCDRDGPWGKLVDRNGWILWFGTDMRTQTAVHAVEDWMRLPYMATCVALVDDAGRTREVEVTQSPAGSRDFYRKDSKSALAWERAGLSRKGTVGRAACELMRAADFIDWLWNALLADPGLLLLDKPDHAWSVEAKKKTAGYLATFKGSWRR